MALVLAAQTRQLRKEQSEMLRFADDRSLVCDHIVLLEEGGDEYDIFLSHAWKDLGAQTLMRTVKDRLHTMVPGLKIFLDVDNLSEGKGAEIVMTSRVVLVLVGEEFFKSKNCMRELLTAVICKKPLVALLADHCLSVATVKQQLREFVKSYAWEELVTEYREGAHRSAPQERVAIPTADEIDLALFGDVGQPHTRPMEWSHQKIYRDTTLRLILERKLLVWKLEVGDKRDELLKQPRPAAASCMRQSLTYLKNDFLGDSFPLPLPRRGRKYHLFVSAHNPGADSMAKELHQRCADEGLIWTSAREEMALCEQFLVYLNAKTWDRTQACVDQACVDHSAHAESSQWSDGATLEPSLSFGAGLKRVNAFQNEIVAAVTKHRLPLLLLHENPSLLAPLKAEEQEAEEPQPERSSTDSPRATHPIAFKHFFEEGVTPEVLKSKEVQIYSPIAKELEQWGQWRAISEIIVLRAIKKPPPIPPNVRLGTGWVSLIGHFSRERSRATPERCRTRWVEGAHEALRRARSISMSSARVEPEVPVTSAMPPRAAPAQGVLVGVLYGESEGLAKPQASARPSTHEAGATLAKSETSAMFAKPTRAAPALSERSIPPPKAPQAPVPEDRSKPSPCVGGSLCTAHGNRVSQRGRDGAPSGDAPPEAMVSEEPESSKALVSKQTELPPKPSPMAPTPSWKQSHSARPRRAAPPLRRTASEGRQLEQREARALPQVMTTRLELVHGFKERLVRNLSAERQHERASGALLVPKVEHLTTTQKKLIKQLHHHWMPTVVSAAPLLPSYDGGGGTRLAPFVLLTVLEDKDRAIILLQAVARGYLQRRRCKSLRCRQRLQEARRLSSGTFQTCCRAGLIKQNSSSHQASESTSESAIADAAASR